MDKINILVLNCNLNPQKSIEESTAQTTGEGRLAAASSNSLFHNITLQQLLGGRKYRMIEDQMLFEKDGTFYLITIDYQKNYTVTENQDGMMVELEVLEEKGSFESKAVVGFVLEVADLFD